MRGPTRQANRSETPTTHPSDRASTRTPTTPHEKETKLPPTTTTRREPCPSPSSAAAAPAPASLPGRRRVSAPPPVRLPAFAPARRPRSRTDERVEIPGPPSHQSPVPPRPGTWIEPATLPSRDARLAPRCGLAPASLAATEQLAARVGVESCGGVASDSLMVVW